MRVCVWKTGHVIADTVADAVLDGIQGATAIDASDRAAAAHSHVNIGYGILRGNEHLRDYACPIIIDRGYFAPGHFDGYYRISLNGTQQTTGLDALPPDYDRMQALQLDFKPWRGFDHSKPVLICPPTDRVAQFFDVPYWLESARSSCLLHGFTRMVTRYKGDKNPINFEDFDFVLTFNSSVGWQAIMAGIPCVSDPVHSIVGARYHKISLAAMDQAQYLDRKQLVAIMSGLQLTLAEIRAGALWPLIRRLQSTSAGIAGKP